MSPVTIEDARQLCNAVAVEHTVQTKDAAALFGLTPQTLRRWACYGSGPVTPLRLNGRLRWPVQAIREALASRTAS